jgi:hypothetical protein
MERVANRPNEQRADPLLETALTAGTGSALASSRLMVYPS